MAFNPDVLNEDDIISQESLEKKEVEPAVPRGWTFLKHGTNLLKWGDVNPYNSNEIELRSSLSVISKEQFEQDQRGGSQYNTTRSYSTEAKPEDMSEEEFAQRNKPFEIRVIFFQDHARTIVDPEYRRGLDKETMDKIKKVYFLNSQQGRHPVLPRKEVLVKLGQIQEGGQDVFYFIPKTLVDVYSKEAGLKNPPV
jgi:hypothetical protein